MPKHVSRAIVLASHPSGAPTPSNLSLIERDLPVPGDGQVLLKTLWLSLDPYIRGRMDGGGSYTDPIKIGGVMIGGAVSVVQTSRRSDYVAGDIVLGETGWQEHTLSDGAGLIKIDPKLAPLTAFLGVMGMPVMTAYTGLLNIGKPQPGETLVVAAASGAVGSIVGQIAKLKSCRVVGIAGGKDKVRYLTNELGFDAGLDRKSANFEAELEAACPSGIDIYFENVGGKIWDAVFPLLNNFARIPICGLIAHYNDARVPSPTPDCSMAVLLAVLKRKRLTLRGFNVDDFNSQMGEFRRDVSGWLRDGKLKYREDVVQGLENAPSAFIRLLEGGNFGKVLVKVANIDRQGRFDRA